MTSWASVAKSARVVAAVARAGGTVKRRPGNAHGPLCARKGGKAQPCTCGATERAKAREAEFRRWLSDAGFVEAPGFLEFDVMYLPGKRFRGDVVHYGARVVVEVQGWANAYGPHGGIAKAKADVEKHSLSAAFGWRVLPVTRDTIRSGEALRLFRAAVAWRP